MPMHIPGNRSKYKRTNLFLLRVWCDDAGENEHVDEGEGACRMWHGMVQRTVSGETRSFEAKASLIEVWKPRLLRRTLHFVRGQTLILTEAQVKALVKAKEEKEAHGSLTERSRQSTQVIWDHRTPSMWALSKV